MVAQCCQVIADMCRRVGLWIAEDRIHSVPCQVRTVLVVTRPVDVLRFVKNGRSSRQEPITGVMDVYIGGGGFEIIDIRSADSAYVAGVTRDEMRKLGVDGEGGRSGGGDPRDLVDGIGEPLHLGLPTSVDTPDGVRQRFGSGVYFGRQRTFAQVHDRSADQQVFVELILQMGAEEALALHRERALVFQFDVHVRTRFENRGVEDSHCTHRVVHGVIDVLDEGGTSGGDGDGASRHIHGAQTDLAAVRAFVFTGKVELVLLAQLLRHDQSRVVQLRETVFLDEPLVIA